jgi:Tol biopolymer transport system component
VDFNFWGITFIDDSRLYATLQTGGRRYLVEADVPTRTARVVDDDIECPSLSPDRTRVAYKKREIVDGRLVWRLAVKNLATRAITVLTESRSVDDQPEWLDDKQIVYGLPSETRAGSTTVWVIPADGSGQPSLLLESAWSPAAIAPAGAAVAR